MMAAAIWGFQQAFTRDLDMGPTDVVIFHADANGLALTGNSETVYGVDRDRHEARPGGARGAAAGARVPQRPVDAADGRPGHRRARPRRGRAVPARAARLRGRAPDRRLRRDDPAAHLPAVARAARVHGARAATPAPAIATLRADEDLSALRPTTRPPTRHIDGTGLSFDTIHPTDIRYFEDLAEMVDYEPYDAISLEESAELAQIGIEKGKPFAPDERMRAILDEAAKVGSYMAFAITNAPRDEYRKYPDRAVVRVNAIPGYPTFEDEHGRPLIDHMVRMAWFATGRALAMAGAKPGVGSAYTWAYRDANGDWIDPARTYRLRLPGPIPAKDFWSVVVYDLWTRSMLANGQPLPSVSTYSPGVEIERRRRRRRSTSAPSRPPGKEANWIRTLPGHRLVPDHPPLRPARSPGSTAAGNPTTSKPTTWPEPRVFTPCSGDTPERWPRRGRGDRDRRARVRSGTPQVVSRGVAPALSCC